MPRHPESAQLYSRLLYRRRASGHELRGPVVAAARVVRLELVGGAVVVLGGQRGVPRDPDLVGAVDVLSRDVWGPTLVSSGPRVS